MSLLDARKPLTTGGVYFGPGYIAGEAPDGLTLVGGVPAQCIVRVSDRASGMVVRQTLSNSDGTYVFHNLHPSFVFDVVCRELTGTWGDRIRYAVRAEPY